MRSDEIVMSTDSAIRCVVLASEKIIPVLESFGYHVIQVIIAGSFHKGTQGRRSYDKFRKDLDHDLYAFELAKKITTVGSVMTRINYSFGLCGADIPHSIDGLSLKCLREQLPKWLVDVIGKHLYSDIDVAYIIEGEIPHWVGGVPEVEPQLNKIIDEMWKYTYPHRLSVTIIPSVRPEGQSCLLIKDYREVSVDTSTDMSDIVGDAVSRRIRCYV